MRYRDIPKMLGTIMWKVFTIIPPVQILEDIRKAYIMRKKQIIMMNKLIDEAEKGNPQAQFMLSMMKGIMEMEYECRCAECSGCHNEQ